MNEKGVTVCIVKLFHKTRNNIYIIVIDLFPDGVGWRYQYQETCVARYKNIIELFQMWRGVYDIYFAEEKDLIFPQNPLNNQYKAQYVAQNKYSNNANTPYNIKKIIRA